MATTSTTVVDLATHPAWHAAQRRSRDREEAMRRHPSFQAASDSRPARLHLV